MSRPTGAVSTLPVSLEKLQKIVGENFNGAIPVSVTFLKGIGGEGAKVVAAFFRKQQEHASTAKKPTPKKRVARAK